MVVGGCEKSESVMRCAAKHLQYLVENKPMQILRCFENTPHPITPTPLPSPQGTADHAQFSRHKEASE